jgi:hypothetical protein
VCESRGTAPPFLTSALDWRQSSASRLFRFTTEKRAPETHLTRGSVDPRASLDAVRRRKISCICQESYPGNSTSSPCLYQLSYPGSHLVDYKLKKKSFFSWILILSSYLRAGLSRPTQKNNNSTYWEVVTIGFWRWCITFRDIGFSDSIHRPGIKRQN